MKLRRHFVLAALAGRRKLLPALFYSRCEAFYQFFLSYYPLHCCAERETEKGAGGFPGPLLRG